jgi:hypothetical protein
LVLETATRLTCPGRLLSSELVLALISITKK